MYGVIGEDDSDVETLTVIIRRLAQDDRLSIKPRGYGSCGEMLKKGAAQIRLFRTLGCTRIVVAYDSDGANPRERYNEVLKRIVKPAEIPHFSSGQLTRGLACCCCILIPTQEIEAWILADIQAVTNVFSSWKPEKIDGNPEDIPSPKEYLERLSRAQNRKPIYTHAIDNKVVAKHLNLGVVRERCVSFRPLVDFVLN